MIKKTLFFGNPCYLSIKQKQLCVVIPDDGSGEEKKTTLPVEDIGVLILDNQQITVSQRVLQLLLENNTAVIVCDEKHHPCGLLLPLSGNTLQTERYKEQIESSEPLRKQLWQQTISTKIRNQAILLNDKGVQVANMLHWSKEVTSGDMKNHEARAAAYYWDKLFESLFRRERFGDPPNNLLNYGYAILRAVVARSLVASGLLPTLGIHHHNRYNAFCLADDVMEPYRPFVDKLVLNILEEEEIEDYDELTPSLKKKLLIIPAMDVLIDNQRSPLMIATQRTCASLAKCFAGETRKILYPELI